MDPLRPPLLRRLRPAQWVVLDCAVAVVAVGGSSLLMRQWMAPSPDLRGLDVVVVVAALLAAGLRRFLPPTGLVIVVLLGAAATALSRQPAPWVATAFAMYLVPLRLGRAPALRILAAALVLAAVGQFGIVPGRHLPAPETLGLLLISLLTVTTAWTIGYAVGQQRLYLAGLRTQEQQEVREQLAEATHAMTAQRLRIARELHDVVAHSMSVIAVQAGVANHVAADQPGEARRALSSIEDTSRGALREMRALLGVLRDERAGAGALAPGAPTTDGPVAAGSTPAPRLCDLDALVERTAQAGVRVDLSVSGQPLELSAGLQLAAYRVVQEAVTNVLKHAATDHCRVDVAYAPDALRICVSDDGQGYRHASNGDVSTGDVPDGHGLAGMRERVGMYGGHLCAGPAAGGGFRVAASFPVTVGEAW